MSLLHACGCTSRRGFLGYAAGFAVAAATGAAYSETPNAFRVDVHHHMYPAALLAGLSKHIKVPPIMATWSPQKSLDQMDKAGIQTAMLSVTAPGVWFGDVAEARDLARACNDYGAASRGDHKDRFGFFAALPLPDMEGSLHRT